MLHEIDVVLPSPWWTPLTYSFETPLQEGLRVLVPLGKGIRIGFSWKSSACLDPSRTEKSLRNLISVLDQTPCLTEDLWRTVQWLGAALPFGIGQVLKAACPSALLNGQEVKPAETTSSISRQAGTPSFCYYPRESDRFRMYTEAIEKNEKGTLVLFPDRERLKSFYETLPAGLRESSCVWPVGGGDRLWETWQAVRRFERKIVLGTSGAVFAPLGVLSLVIVEEEADPGHQMPLFPRLSARSVAAKRASYSGASLILGGTFPSSRVLLSSAVIASELPKGRVFFVQSPSLSRSGDPSFSSSREIPLSRKLLDETRRCLKDGRNALWLLDRKGYAGELHCLECGRTILCGRCGGRTRWHFEKKSGECLSCGEEIPWPEVCPFCRSPLLEARQLGLESTYQAALDHFKEEKQVFLLAEFASMGKRARKELYRELGQKAGLLLGTRSLLGLCRNMDVGLIAWLDADTSNWKPDFGARAEGFRIIWESCWVGKNPETRKVLLQSRRPRQGWQIALEAGFHYFWNQELRERKELKLPPYSFLVEVSHRGEMLTKIKDAMEQEGIEVLSGIRAADSIQVKVLDLGKLRRILEPFFSVKNVSRNNVPRLCVDFE